MLGICALLVFSCSFDSGFGCYISGCNAFVDTLKRRATEKGTEVLSTVSCDN